MVSLQKEDQIFILTIPITFRVETLQEIHQKLDEVENNPGPTALVITSSHGRIFSAGMDLKFMAQAGPKAALDIFTPLMHLFGRLLHFSVPTVCAIRGHVVAGGVMLALATDYRIMSEDLGTVKMTEVNLGMVLPRGGNIILKAKLDSATHRDILLKGKVFNPRQAFDAKIVDKLCPKDAVLNEAKELAKELSAFGEKKKVYKLLKYSTYKNEIDIANSGEFSEEEKVSAMQRVQPKL